MAAVRGCAICKKMLEAERSEIPETTLCLEHAAMIERFGDEFLRVATQENLSKEKSFRKSPGGVSVKLERNEAAIEQLRDQYERTHR
jgi:hypothetical protein